MQDKIRSVQDEIQRINTCIEEHESERSTKYRELRRKEQIFKGIRVLSNCLSNHCGGCASFRIVVECVLNI